MRQAAPARIRGGVASVNAVVAENFVANDYQMATQVGLEMISLMTFIAGALAVTVVGFRVYRQTRRRHIEIAIARAIGVRPGALLVVATAQAAAVGALGVALAMAIAWLVRPSIMKPVLRAMARMERARYLARPISRKQMGC